MNETLRDIRNSRQAMLVSKDISKQRVVVIGAGGIGSNMAHVLASMGVEDLTVYDHDEVGEENVWPQFYGIEDVGMPKVEALYHRIESSTGIEIKPVHEKYVDQEDDADIVVTGLDSMKERWAIYKKAKRKGMDWKLWVDGRMGGMGCSFFVLDCDDENSIEWYESYALDPTVKGELACGEKSTAYITKGLLTGAMAAAINSWLMGVPYPKFWHLDLEGGLWRMGEIIMELPEVVDD